jgi:hypothetical protein
MIIVYGYQKLEYIAIMICKLEFKISSLLVWLGVAVQWAGIYLGCMYYNIIKYK